MKDNPTILIVDDEARNIELQKAYLEPYSYKILTAANGEEAIKIAAGENIDLILMDVMMPGKDGFVVTKHLKSLERTRIIPVILVTALTEKAEKVKGIEAGCDDFISKPVDSCELLARVRSLLKVKAYNDHMRNYERELETEVAKRTKELYTAMVMIEEASLETINRLAAVAEYRDEYTGSHITRMSRYTAAIAQKMSLDGGLAKALLYAAPMHDIGKIGIPDRILLKPGKLDTEEWELMKQHTVIGAKLLQGSKHGYMKLAEEIALTHHEKWDGTGYPQGLKGEHIPISGRVVAVADVFDAIIFRRPYKPALSPKEAFTLIEEERGTHFDPDIIDAFIGIKPEILSIVGQYKNYE
jgi:putative two-component system response regulator